MKLKRDLGVGGAVLLGLGSILGSGVFVSLSLAAGMAGPAMLIAIALAAGVAACNALSSAQLAASHPVSGGTYEYGYRYLNGHLGFAAGWLFLTAKSASAATAALALAGYSLALLGFSDAAAWLPIALAMGATVLVTAVVLAGIRRSAMANLVLVSITIAGLLAFIVGLMPTAWEHAAENLQPFFVTPTDGTDGNTPVGIGEVLAAAALLFVAYTGYGRVATLGEEVREPRRTIPRAIGVTVVVSAALYLLVGLVAMAAAGADAFADAADGAVAPLATVAGETSRTVALVVSVSAIVALLGVLLNLVLGLSRVLLAMGRRGDMPPAVARLTASQNPAVAVAIMGGVIAALTLMGDVKLTWSLSAIAVLVYYATTNAAALALPTADRLYPRWVSVVGLVDCVGLAAFVEPAMIAVAAGVLFVGLLWRAVARRWFAAIDEPSQASS